jgi:hypothetical protein
MDDVQELQSEFVPEQKRTGAEVQAGAYLLELSLDWIVLRASENIHHLLGESHVTLIDEPLGRFVHAQALHDLRNLFSRLSGTTGIARAYGIRLTDEPDLADVAFHLCDGRVLLEAVSSTGSFGSCFGSVGGLVAGLSGSRGQALLDNGARRMRALTGYDRVTLSWGEGGSESTRGAFEAGVMAGEDLPIILADASAGAIPLFPRGEEESSACDALMRHVEAKPAPASNSVASSPVFACRSLPRALPASSAATAAGRANQISSCTPPPSSLPSCSQCALRSTA